MDAAANFGCRNVGISASSAKAVNLCPILPVSSVWLALPLRGTIYSLRWSSSECRKVIEMLPSFDGNNFGKLDRNQQQPMPIIALTYHLDHRTFNVLYAYFIIGLNVRSHYDFLRYTNSLTYLLTSVFDRGMCCQELNADTELAASNGQAVKALTIFAHSLRFFRNHALQELADQSRTLIVDEDVRWIISVPAIWKEPAKQFMRQAAYQV